VALTRALVVLAAVAAMPLGCQKAPHRDATAAGATGATGGTAAHDTSGDRVAAMWRARAASYPAIADWLLLRAALATTDTAARSALYARIESPLARSRIPWTEAAAREATGDLARAAALYDSLGAHVTALRIRAAADTSAAGLARVRVALLALADSARAPATRNQAAALFEHLFPHPDATEALALARAGAAAGAAARTRTEYARADSGHAVLSPRDRFEYAMALAAGNLDRAAAAQFARVSAPVSFAAAAQYQRARSLLALGDRAGAVRALRSVTVRFPTDTAAAAALALLADLASDTRADAQSRALLRSVVRRFPRSRFAAPAAFDAALLAYVGGDLRTAAREFAALAATGNDWPGATYWLGRVRLAQHDTARARAAWYSVIARDSLSYYAALAGARLGHPAAHVALDSVTYPEVPAVDSAARRIALLDSLGMGPEARLESDRMYRDAASTPERLLATGAAFMADGQANRAIALGWRALGPAPASAAVLRLVYPLAARDTIVTAARSEGLDPALVAGLIRQESNFNPTAVSTAGARGLMQLMPSVGESLARAAGIGRWSPGLLFDPGLNVQLGVRHLAPLVHAQPSLARALAAYNAGGSRVARWATRRGAADPEVFTERIPFPETRDYVKNVLRNRAAYQILYRW